MARPSPSPHRLSGHLCVHWSDTRFCDLPWGVFYINRALSNHCLPCRGSADTGLSWFPSFLPTGTTAPTRTCAGCSPLPPKAVVMEALNRQVPETACLHPRWSPTSTAPPHVSSPTPRPLRPAPHPFSAPASTQLCPFPIWDPLGSCSFGSSLHTVP